jgi:polyisoprenoid-binding protein YceI
MTTYSSLVRALGGIVALALVTLFPLTAAAQDAAPLRLTAAKVSLAGNSNIHPFTATTTDVRMSRLVLAPAEGDRLQAAAKAGGVEAFEVAIKAATLTSPKDGLDKNMHKALKTKEFPEIVFRLNRIEGNGVAPKAFGTLKIAGVEKEIAIDLKTVATATTLTVSGQVPLLMTDYGIPAPKAMMGMLKTDPKITVKFETVFAVSTTY